MITTFFVLVLLAVAAFGAYVNTKLLGRVHPVKIVVGYGAAVLPVATAVMLVIA